jgi:hypothetical protein
MSFPFLEAWRCIRALVDRGHLHAAVSVGLPKIVALKLYRGKLLERIIKADANRVAVNNGETKKAQNEFIGVYIKKIYQVNFEYNREFLKGIIPLTHVEQNGTKATTEVRHVHRKAHRSPVLRPLPG